MIALKKSGVITSASRAIESTRQLRRAAVIASGMCILAAFAVSGRSDSVTASLSILAFLAGGAKLNIGVSGADRQTRADAGGAVALAAAIACGPLGAAPPAAMAVLGRVFLTADDRAPLRSCLHPVALAVVQATLAGLAFSASNGGNHLPFAVASLPAAIAAAAVYAIIEMLSERRFALGTGLSFSLTLGYMLACAARSLPTYVILMPALPAGFALLRLLVKARQATVDQRTQTVAEPDKPAFIDPLTGLANQRYLEMFLQQEFSRSERYGYAMTLLLVDIDDFDGLNSENGSEACDRYIAALGDSLQKMLRDYDMAARYKDDEFVIILPETDVQSGTQIAQRIHAAISGQLLPLRATFSIGVAEYPTHGMTTDALLGSAHHALNRAKFSGKNKVCSCHELAKAS